MTTIKANLSKRILTGFALIAFSSAALAEFPEKPIKIFVGFPPGGGVDVAARAISTELAKQIQSPVVVENLAGAGGNIATDRVVKSNPDGYTLLFGSIASAINPSLYKLSFDPVKQLRTVGMVSTSPYVLLAGEKSGIRTVEDIISMKNSKENITFASAGNGSGSHLFMQQFMDIKGIQLTHIPYKGAAPAINDVLGGQVQLVFDSIMTTLPHIRSGKLKAIGVSSKKDAEIAPKIPPLEKIGVKGMDSTSWFIIFAPAGTPDATIEKINKELNAVLKTDTMKQRFFQMGAEIKTSTPLEAQTFYESEVTKWRSVVSSSGVRLD